MMNRTEQIKEYLKRLNSDENFEDIRADFIKDFSEVEAYEIMQAEQELLKEGMPLAEVQKLCDVHSSLFHGTTMEEKIKHAELAVEESLLQKKAREELAKRDSFPQKDYSNKEQRAADLAAIPGHPLNIFTLENKALEVLLEEFKTTDNEDLLSKISAVTIHYARKGDLLYPHLSVKYGISGPSDVMWTVDDEIRDELARLNREKQHDTAWHNDVRTVLQRIQEMIYKEQNILFPICAVNFTKEEWYQVYHDMKDYPLCFSVPNTIWTEAENFSGMEKAKITAEKTTDDITISMPGGQLKLTELIALLNTIPLEITFIDADQINRFFNEGPKVFKRPAMALGRDVFFCHPPKVQPMVRSIIEDFRSGKRDSVPVWMNKSGKPMLVTYMAVRDQAKRYLGTLELVQDMEFAKEHFQK